MVFWYNKLPQYACVCSSIYTMCICECVCSVGWAREEGKEFSLLQASETLYWNVNWYDWSASQITHKATFNKPEIRMSHCLTLLSQESERQRERERECVCECVCVRRRGEWCLLESLPFLFLPLSHTSHCLITNKRPEILQSVRWFMGRLIADVLLRLERQCFEVMLMKSLSVLQI